MSTCCGGCTGSICIHLTPQCTGGSVGGQTFSVLSGTTVIGTATTDSSGNACVAITAAGTYTWKVTDPTTGFIRTGTVAATCTVNNVTATLSGGRICVTVNGCAGVIPGGTVTFTLGATVYTASVDTVTGIACSPNGIANGTWTVQYAPDSGSPCFGTVGTLVAVSGGNCAAVTFNPSVIRPCCCHQSCGSPPGALSNVGTLFFTSSILGSVTLTESASCTWTGTVSYTFPIKGPCSIARTVTVTVSVLLPAGGLSPVVEYLWPVFSSGTNCCAFATGPDGCVDSVTGTWSSCSDHPIAFGGTITWPGNFATYGTTAVPALDTITVTE